MSEEWQSGIKVVAMTGFLLAAGGFLGALLFGAAVVLPAELFFDAVWLETYLDDASWLGAATIGVRLVGTAARLTMGE